MHTWKCAASRNAYSAIVYSFSWHAPSRSGHNIVKSKQCQTDQVQQLGTGDAGWRVSKDLSIFGVSMLTHTLTLTYLLCSTYAYLPQRWTSLCLPSTPHKQLDFLRVSPFGITLAENKKERSKNKHKWAISSRSTRPKEQHKAKEPVKS